MEIYYSIDNFEGREEDNCFKVIWVSVKYENRRLEMKVRDVNLGRYFLSWE